MGGFIVGWNQHRNVRVFEHEPDAYQSLAYNTTCVEAARKSRSSVSPTTHKHRVAYGFFGARVAAWSFAMISNPELFAMLGGTQ